MITMPIAEGVAFFGIPSPVVFIRCPAGECQLGDHPGVRTSVDDYRGPGAAPTPSASASPWIRTIHEHTDTQPVSGH